MQYSSRVLSLLLALCIASVTTIGLAFFRSTTAVMLAAAFAISFAESYLLLFFLIEVLVFREIHKIHALINKLRGREASELNENQSAPLHRLRAIHDDILSFAESKQEEIDELRKLEAFRKEFIADVSHELKTPIFAAQGFVHTLLDGAVDDKTVRTKFLKKAARSLDGLDALVEDLLTLSQIETGQVKMHFDSIDLFKLTEEVLEQFETKASKRHIKLKISGERPVMAFADPLRISQVMSNLVSNAVNHSYDHSEVVVELDVGKKRVKVSVIDTGEGIPPEHVHRIFERFYRVDKSRSRSKGGTGLGLAIVKHILEGHHTRPSVVSAPGEGSVFSFKLPRNKEVMDRKSGSGSSQH